ncbi:MAG: Rrf2 family transcriptional regulator [Candidatus Omnitrophica bacterium]|nr:Rrf2 family transcriptional regulator [Candidatus Omnitrophota bacterium]
MNFILRDTDYAIRALVYIAKMAKKKKAIFTVDEIVRKEDLPERFLRRILQKLAKKGLLCSHKGKEGGFSLTKSPKDIKLTDIIKVFQGDVDLTNCFLKGKICPEIKTCALRKKLKEIGRGLDRELKAITIASLV